MGRVATNHGTSAYGLSQQMSMVYNPASTNTCESHEWSDAPITYKDVDWNVFVLETRIDDHLQNNDLLINNAQTSQAQGTNRQQTHEILNANEGEVTDLPDYTDEHLELRWMKSDLAIDYDDDKDNIRDDYLQSDELNEFQSPKVSHLSKTKKSSIK